MRQLGFSALRAHAARRRIDTVVRRPTGVGANTSHSLLGYCHCASPPMHALHLHAGRMCDYTQNGIVAKRHVPCKQRAPHHHIFVVFCCQPAAVNVFPSPRLSWSYGCISFAQASNWALQASKRS